ncbi:EscF/YscF/HrpA family type III secretion system needle major subunit [Paraburkholderia bonniea]|uniref:EscF/YscF/HrpA family type III secretion system needle major subunit n=1 Tax=Paraburkholderia bonniea TaxID=2152891 RepID=UPI001291DC4E|nr:EscF/YscF/HrpA family type III secretion system needle major subunit [Paraburkholderia bonniea]WJF89325.1 EscF/YscF/HrpA family type III secretion system needle major subunit [Paraburkholderia bonniea]WJF92641.1 EscF/YscF/HrpA family type III secretion system needle major subunit [Paraburkholderia bonniea]
MPTYNPSSNSLNIDGFAAMIGTSVDSAEADLQSTLNALGKSPTEGDLLKAQQKLQTWSMDVSMDATVIKEIGDTLKGVIQKAG